MNMAFDFPKVQYFLDGDDLIIDCFAGGGGTSKGIELALGRSPDYALNHDGPACAMHAANHPKTIHIQRNVNKIDPMEIVGRRRVGLFWASPDCKHHSKAKGSRPVKREIRDLAWNFILWARRTRPKVMILENVEEFLDWGPLIERDPGEFYPDPARKGETFQRWRQELIRLGFKVEYQLRRACDYGDPTIRRRLILIARSDGQPIVWPEPSHGKPASPAVISGLRQPHRTVAECIDWWRPCPSIFETAEEIKRKYGLQVKRPLVENTERRIAHGIKNRVIDDENRFLMTYAQHGGGTRSPDEPMHTITASSKDQNAIVVPYLVPRYQEKQGDQPRIHSVDEPSKTIIAGGNVPGSLVTPKLMNASYIQRDFGQGVGHSAQDPLSTITSGGGGHARLVSAFMAQNNTGALHRAADAPVATITCRGTQQAIISAHMLHLKGSKRSDSGVEEPLNTICASGGHAALVSALLIKYYGTGIATSVDEPIHSITTKDRFALITVTIQGIDYVIVDIGMRMLTARELFRAQGFPDEYVIDPIYRGKKLTKKQQVSCCGNSVPPGLARAHVAANCDWMAPKSERIAA